MMGPAHSLSGAAAWLGVGAVAAATGHEMPWPVLVVGALICAGAALAPDLDHKAATISRAFGPVSKTLCEVVDKISYAAYKTTRKPGDPTRNGGHRTLTHTWLWAVLVGGGASGLALIGGRWAVLFILFVHMVLAIEGLMWKAARTSSDILVWLLGATSAWTLASILDKPGNGSNWLFTGDALTVSGCPILWPIPLGRKRWYPLGPPKSMRFRAGSWVELKVLTPAFVVLGGIGAAVALGIFS